MALLYAENVIICYIINYMANQGGVTLTAPEMNGVTLTAPTNSVLVEDQENLVIVPPTYSEEEQKYLNKLQKKLENSATIREQNHKEFDYMTFTEYHQSNEAMANVELKPKKDKNDIQYKSGTLRTKLFGFLSSLLGLNLSADIVAYNEDEIAITKLGNAMEDVIDKTEELDEDEEKKMLRQYEMLKQGFVFVEELWNDRLVIEREVVGNYHGQFRGVKIKNKIVRQQGRPTRNILSGLSVYLGDLTKYLISEQPYIFTVQYLSFQKAKAIYGGFEMFKHVNPNATVSFTGGQAMGTMVRGDWRLLEAMSENKDLEVIKYQSKPDSEYQIIINSVPMLPLGFPFPWGHREYNIAQQNYKPIRADFSYGKSFLFENKNPVQMLDEMTKLALLKDKKSYLPPYVNTSGRVISPNVLRPNTITMGIQPGTLVPISPYEVQGVTNGEFSMIKLMTNGIDRDTTSQTFTGSPESGQVTATQIVEIQRQAKMMLGLTIFTASLLEKKLAILRLMTLLKNWFNPIDNVLDKARQALRNRYRIVSRQRNIDGEGPGIRMVMPTEEKMTSEELMNREDQMQEQYGVPFRIIALNPRELEEAKLTWTVNVVAREKKSSEMSKLMFETMITQGKNLGLVFNPSHIEERFAEVWEEDPTKLFEKQTIAPVIPGMEPGGQVVAPGGAPVAPEQQNGGGSAPMIKRPRVSIQQPGANGQQ